MFNEKRLTSSDFAGEAWSDAFLREVDLVIAEGVHHSLLTGETLYETVIGGRVASFAAALDAELREDFLGVVALPNVEGDYKAQQQAYEDAFGCLRSKPRGAWLIGEHEGRFDVFMSDGKGRISTPSGNRFSYAKPTAPALTFENAYASVLGTLVYERRNAIENEIMRSSFDAAGLKPGHVVRDSRINGKTWTKVTFDRIEEGYYVGHADAIKVAASRRGVSKQFILPKESAYRVFGCPPVLPAAYVSDDGVNRSHSLTERRERAATSVMLAEINLEPEKYGRRHPTWRRDGDDYVANVYLKDATAGEPAGVYRVEFAPDSDKITDAVLELDAPAPAMR